MWGGLNECFWLDVEFCAMEVDGGDEAVQVSVVGGMSFQGHEFAVEALGDGVMWWRQ